MAVHRVLALVLTGATVVGLAAGCTSDGSDGAASTPASTEAAATDTAAGSPSPGARSAVPSPGCAVAQPAPGRTDEVVVSGPDERGYARFVPAGADRDVPAPLVVDLTAYSPASLEEAFSGFTTTADDGTVKADEEGIVVITPEPTNGSGSLLTWNYVGTEGWTDDQAFLRDLLDEVEAENCIVMGTQSTTSPDGYRTGRNQHRAADRPGRACPELRRGVPVDLDAYSLRVRLAPLHRLDG